jgi:phosphohistidine phosphatase SixA
LTTHSTLALAILLAGNTTLALACDEWPDVVHVLRHAEKADPRDGDSALSAKGWCMAGTLPKTLAGENIVAIFVTELKRTQQTAMSLAEYSGTAATVIPKDDHAALMQAICDAGKAGQVENVVVIGHESTVPLVMKDLGAAKRTPDYGDLFSIAPAADSMVTERYGDLCDQKM